MLNSVFADVLPMRDGASVAIVGGYTVSGGALCSPRYRLAETPLPYVGIRYPLWKNAIPGMF